MTRLAGTRPKLLVVGKDARTHAIVAACVASPQRPRVFGLTELPIPGLVEQCERVFIGSLLDVDGLVKIAREVEPDLVIIGPEEPLGAGFTDALRRLGIAVFGPTRQLAAIEWSKSWARRLLDQHRIAGNPEYRVFDSKAGLRQYMVELGDVVVKPDGLTAGKGVRVMGEHLHCVDDALSYAEAIVEKDGRVEIEERLEGEEFSLQTITDGETVIHCPLAQDHKRAREGDQGPNTGGMGSYSCPDFSLPFLDRNDVAEAQSINEQVIDALARETGERYKGVLYGGFIATGKGVRLIEYNSRFGDPEALNVIPLLRADFVDLCAAAAAGELQRVEYDFEPKATVCKYIVPSTYPEPLATDERIVVPEELTAARGLRWYWAACEQREDGVYLTSSRSGAVVGIADSLGEAESLAEHGASLLVGPVRHRRDIGTADLVDARIAHMRSLRGERIGAHN